MDFEKWLEENYPVVGLDICEKEGNRYIHKSTRNMHEAYLSGQQSKQAEIDALQQQNQRLAMRLDVIQGVLQKQIDLIVELKNDT